MPKQTRKRKQKGGAIPYLPREIFPIAGDSQNNLISDFFTRAHIYYVSAHGALYSEKTYEVPPNTYILHVGVSGKVCHTHDAMNEFLISEGFSRDKKREMMWKFLTGQRLYPAMNNILYKPDRFNERTNTVAIYEPGDVVHDMLFSFENTSADSGYIQLGAFKFPFAENLLQQPHELGLRREGEFMKTAMKYGGINSPVYRARRNRIAKDFANANDNFLRYRADNKLRGRFQEIERNAADEANKYSINESKFVELEDFFVPEATHHRVFIVFSCRKVFDTLPEEVEHAGRRMRKASLNLRSYANRPRVFTNRNVNRLANETLIEMGIKRREDIPGRPIVPVRRVRARGSAAGANAPAANVAAPAAPAAAAPAAPNV